MKAVVLESPGVLVHREVPRPAPAPDEVLVEVRAASICGSDVLRTYAGHAKTYPLIMGHEFAGVVVACGADAGPDWLGRRVSAAPLIPCMQCVYCRNGVYASCRAYSFIGSRRSGAYAEFCAVPAANLIELPGSMDFELGAILEPSTVAVHALDRGGFAPGMALAVLGAGSIGQYVIQWARIGGARLIVATDAAGENLACARAMGAQHAFNPQREDIVASALALSEDGFDLVVEAVGLPETLLQAVALTRPRGKVVCVGNQPHGGSLSTEVIEQAMRHEAQLCGTWMSYSAPFPGHEWTDTVAAAVRGDLDMRAMISHHFPLAELPQVMAEINAHTLVHRKVIITP